MMKVEENFNPYELSSSPLKHRLNFPNVVKSWPNVCGRPFRCSAVPRGHRGKGPACAEKKKAIIITNCVSPSMKNAHTFDEPQICFSQGHVHVTSLRSVAFQAPSLSASAFSSLLETRQTLSKPFAAASCRSICDPQKGKWSWP